MLHKRFGDSLCYRSLNARPVPSSLSLFLTSRPLLRITRRRKTHRPITLLIFWCWLPSLFETWFFLLSGRSTSKNVLLRREQGCPSSKLKDPTELSDGYRRAVLPHRYPRKMQHTYSSFVGEIRICSTTGFRGKGNCNSKRRNLACMRSQASTIALCLYPICTPNETQSSRNCPASRPSIP